MGCFWTTFLGSDPSKPGIPYRKKPTRDNRAIFPTRLRSSDEPRFCLGNIFGFGWQRCEAGKQATKQQATRTSNNKQQATSNKHNGTCLRLPLRVTHSHSFRVRGWRFRWRGAPQVGDLSNALSFIGRAPFLSSRSCRFCMKMCEAGKEAGEARSKQQSKQSKQA